MSSPSVAADPAVLDRRVLPALARGVELFGELRGSGYRRAPGLVRRRDGQTLQLTPLLYAVLAAVDGRRDHRALAAAVTEQIGRPLTEEDAAYLVDAKLRPLGVLREADGHEPVTTPANPLLALRWRYVVTDPALTERLTGPFAALFRPTVVALVTAAFVATVAWLFLGHGLAGPTHATFTDPRMVLLVVGLTVLSTGFHEFGHAAACRYGGATPGVMGAGLYLVWPAFYTDVSDSYRLGRAGRLRVDLGGLYFNAVFSEAVVLAWWLLRKDALLLVVATQVLQMLRQLVPLVRFDGYHILADVTGVPDLFSHLGPTLAGVLPGRRRRRPGSVLKPWARAVVTLWVAVVVPVLAAVLVGMVLLLPRVAATAWEGILAQGDLLAAHWAAGEVAAAAVRALSVVTLGLPVLGMAYLLVRVVGRAARRVWRVAGDDPRRRVGAVVTAVVTVAAVALAWWPQGQYEPVAPASRRTVEPVVAPELPTGRHGDPLLAARGREPRLVAATVDEPVEEPPVVQAAAAPARDRAATAMAAPAKVERPAWPFTWAPPPAPRPEDNRGWAVNTRDGWFVSSVRIDEAWYADGATVAPRNEAWALAQCLECRTVAVAFQAVFVIGSSDVITPVNTSVAANEACEACATHAVAVQVVTSLAAAPEAPTMAAIRRVLAELEGLRGRVRTMTPEEIRAVLAAAGDRILAIVTDAGLLLEATDGDQQATEQELGADTEAEEEVATSGAAEEEPGTDGVLAEQPLADQTEGSTEDGVSIHAPPEQPTTAEAEATDDTATDAFAPAEPATAEPATQEATAEEATAEEAATEEPATEEPPTDDPPTDDPPTDDPPTDDPATEDPATEDPATEDPATEDPAADEGAVATG